MDRRTRGARAVLKAIPPPLEGPRIEPRCRVCTAPTKVRQAIEHLLPEPCSYSETLRRVSPLLGEVPAGRRPSVQSVARHSQRHLGFEALALRELAERRARERGIDVAEAAGRLLTAEAFMEAVARSAFRGLADGSLRATLSEGIQAVRALKEFEGDADVAATLNAFRAEAALMGQVLQRVLGPDQMQEFERRFHAEKARRQRGAP